MIRKPVKDVLSVIGQDVKVELSPTFGYVAELIEASGFEKTMFTAPIFELVLLLVDEHAFSAVKEKLAAAYKSYSYVEYPLRNPGDIMVTFIHNGIYFKIASGKFDDVFDEVNYMRVSPDFPALITTNYFHGFIRMLSETSCSPEYCTTIAFFLAVAARVNAEKSLVNMPLRYIESEKEEDKDIEFAMRKVFTDLMLSVRERFDFDHDGICILTENLIEHAVLTNAYSLMKCLTQN